jgi:putative nucleotidyltransferase with HDIG domain
MVKAVEAKDPYTKGHSENVAEYAVNLARYAQLPESEIEIIKYAALLHDVGKIGVAQEVLTKQAPLTDAEFELLKKHPVIGISILKDVRFLEKEIPLILHHHERIDGKGYPHGLKGREIPLGARMLAVIDAFEAMTAGRTYRKSISQQQAIQELINGKGTQFDSELVDIFIKMLAHEKNPVSDATL